MQFSGSGYNGGSLLQYRDDAGGPLAGHDGSKRGICVNCPEDAAKEEKFS